MTNLNLGQNVVTYNNNPSNTPENTSTAIFNENIYIFWAPTTNIISFVTYPPSLTATASTPTVYDLPVSAQGIHKQPFAVVFQNNLYLFFTGPNNTCKCKYLSTPPNTWHDVDINDPPSFGSMRNAMNYNDEYIFITYRKKSTTSNPGPAFSCSCAIFRPHTAELILNIIPVEINGQELLRYYWTAGASTNAETEANTENLSNPPVLVQGGGATPLSNYIQVVMPKNASSAIYPNRADISSATSATITITSTQSCAELFTFPNNEPMSPSSDGNSFIWPATPQFIAARRSSGRFQFTVQVTIGENTYSFDPEIIVKAAGSDSGTPGYGVLSS